MTTKELLSGYVLSSFSLEGSYTYTYGVDSKMFNTQVAYKYFLSDIAKIYGLDPCFYFDEEAIVIIIDHIVLPTYEEFRTGISKNVTLSIVDDKEKMSIFYTLFSDIE